MRSLITYVLGKTLVPNYFQRHSFLAEWNVGRECSHWSWVQITVQEWGGESSGIRDPEGDTDMQSWLGKEVSFRTPRQGEAYDQQRRVSLLGFPLKIIWALICRQWWVWRQKSGPLQWVPHLLVVFFKKLDSAMLCGNIKANADSNSCHPRVCWLPIKKLPFWGNV